MKWRFIPPQKRKPPLAKTCQSCRKEPAKAVHYVKWYRTALPGSYNTRWASLCSDCCLTLRVDFLPEPRS